MSGPLRTAVGVALIAVLAGAPVAAAVCAEWCAPPNPAGHTRAHHGAPASAHEPATSATAQECHGKAVGAGPTLAADMKPECVDYALSWREAGPIAPRLHLAPVVSTSAAVFALHSHLQLGANGLALRPAHASPPRPVVAGSPLRI